MSWRTMFDVCFNCESHLGLVYLINVFNNGIPVRKDPRDAKTEATNKKREERDAEDVV